MLLKLSHLSRDICHPDHEVKPGRTINGTEVSDLQIHTEPGSRGPATQKKKYLKIKFLVIEFAFFQKNFRLKKLELRHYQSDVELTVGCENVWHKMRNVLHGDVQGLAMQDGGDEMTIV